MLTPSVAKYFYDFSQEKVREGFALDSAEGVARSVEALDRLGVGMEPNMHLQMVMDAMPSAGVTTASNQVPVQFLQHWMNRFITVMTQACKADELLGRTTIGEWFQESVVLRVRELTGSVRPYGDHAQPPVAGYNWNYEERTIVRFAQGILTGKLEEQRMAAVGQKASAYESDRAALSLAFKLNQNAVAFFGYNLGRNRTYGLLNDPNLPDYVQVPEVALSATETSTKWEDKDFYEIVRDLTVMVATAQTQCKGNFDPRKDPFKFGIPLSCAQYLAKVNEHGHSVYEFVEKTWPKATFVDVPEFDNALAGDNVLYIIVQSISGNPVVEQVVPATVRLIGAVPRATGLYELYSDATAGCFVEQPLGIVRFFGI